MNGVANKRELSDDENENQSKRSRHAIVPVNNEVVKMRKSGDRTSKLSDPNLVLSGHGGAVYSVKFDPSGQFLATASFDKSIMLWEVYGGCRNYNVLTGHQNAVLDVHWTSDGSHLVSAAADRTVGIWDAEVGTRVKKLTGHKGVVNSVCPVRRGPILVVSGSDDGAAKLWDIRTKLPVESFHEEYPVTSVCFSDDGKSVFSGNLDSVIRVWDVRKGKVSSELKGHESVVSGLSLSTDGHYLASVAQDSTVRRWDVRPFVTGDRCQSVYYGLQHNFERNCIKCGWSPDGSKIISGSSDRNVFIWDTLSTNVQYHLSGHTGPCNEAIFHPKEPIIASCGSDKKVLIGELAV